jgi:hypothetical protein
LFETIAEVLTLINNYTFMRAYFFRCFNFILVVVLISSCSSTNLVFMNVQEPAPITMPPYIKAVGVINRSLPTEETKKVNVIDEVLSIEGPELDKAGAIESVAGLGDELSKNDRFTDVANLNDIDLRTTGAGVFPAALSWETVQQICTDRHLDALFSLELFDTDTKVNYTATPITVKTPFGSIPGFEHQANMTTYVKTGWRIYDPAGKNIIDEYTIGKTLNFSGKGITPALALEGLIGRKDAVKQAGNAAGHQYAITILPYWTRVTRDYYVRGTYNFKIAQRKARTGNWDEAAQLWEKETNNGKRKVAGRACYNMAIINEINGDLDAAIGWAQKSYENYNIRLALRYVNILRNRKARTNVLRQQEY